MYHLKKLWPVLALSLMLFTACDTDERPPEAVDEHLPPDIEAAREYFNEYASQEVEYELIGMHPGAIAADWTDVTTVVRDDMTVYNVALFTEARYSGSFYIDPEVSEESYSTAIYQRLIVCRYPAGYYACFLASIIPAADCATMNREKISDMFMCGDNGERGFSGIVTYATVTTNYTVMIEQYRDGKGVRRLSLYEPYDDYNALIDEMRRMIGAKNISRQLVATSRSGGEFGSGITLPNVDVVGNGGGNGGGSNPGGGVPTLPPPYQPPGPSYPGGNNTPPVFPPGYDRPGNGNIGNGGNNNDGTDDSKPKPYVKSSTDKLIRPNIESMTFESQLSNTCVSTSMVNASILLEDPLDQGKLDKFYIQFYKGPDGEPIKNTTYYNQTGVSFFERERDFVSHFFEVRPFFTFHEALTNNIPILGTISGGDNSYHCVLIIGYTEKQHLIYVDPTDAKIYTAPTDYFYDLNITITKVKKR